MSEQPKEESVARAKALLDKELDKANEIWNSGKIQRAIEKGSYFAALGTGAFALGSVIFAGAGLLVASMIVGSNILSHAIIERYPHLSHKSVMTMSLECNIFIAQWLQASHMEWKDLDPMTQSKIIEQAISSVANLRRQGAYKL